MPDFSLKPDLRAKPLVSMRFPDAGAGKDENASIEKQIFELADKGFGCEETAMLMSFGVKYENDKARGWDYGKICAFFSPESAGLCRTKRISDRSTVFGMGPGIIDSPDTEAYYNGLQCVRNILYTSVIGDVHN